MKCREWQEMLYDFLDEALPAVQAEEMRAHVQECELCRRKLLQERDFSVLMSEAGGTLSSHIPALSHRQKNIRIFRFRPFIWLPASALASAVLLIMFHSCPSRSLQPSDGEWRSMMQAFHSIQSNPQEDLRRANLHLVRIDPQGKSTVTDTWPEECDGFEKN